MPAPYTFSKGLSEAQFNALEAARRKAGLSLQELKDRVLREFCEAQGVKWPGTAQHGGSRHSIRFGEMTCPRCGREMYDTEADPRLYRCECGLHWDENTGEVYEYEYDENDELQKVIRDHRNTGWTEQDAQERSAHRYQRKGE